MSCHRCYTNNLEAPHCSPALLIVPEIINFVRCIVLLLLVARLLFITTGQKACHISTILEQKKNVQNLSGWGTSNSKFELNLSSHS